MVALPWPSGTGKEQIVNRLHPEQFAVFGKSQKFGAGIIRKDVVLMDQIDVFHSVLHSVFILWFGMLGILSITRLDTGITEDFFGKDAKNHRTFRTVTIERMILNGSGVLGDGFGPWHRWYVMPLQKK